MWLLTGRIVAAAPLPDRAELGNIIPTPARMVAATGSFAIRDGTQISIPADSRLLPIASYLRELLYKSSGVRLQVAVRAGTQVPAHAIELRLGPGSDEQTPESYAIEVSSERLIITAGEVRGLFYGAVTLWQLCDVDAVRPGERLSVPAGHIVDAPRFGWRGLMLDSARHFQSPAFILRYLDWMALHKLNVLSWHLTDDQGWRLQIKRYPRLTELGAWRVPAGRAAQRDLDPATGRPRLYGGFYTQQDVRRIVAHAAARNITIVPEIDLPGHVTAALVAYPQLAASAAPPRAVPADWGTYPNLLNAEESTFEFLQNVLDEVMALFPGKYIHLGGDEVVTDQWRDSVRVQQRLRELGLADASALQSYFTARLAAYLARHGRRLVGWDEILEGGAPQNAIVVSWRGTQGAIRAAAAGHDTVLAPDPTFYFDNRQGRGADEPPGRGRIVTVEDIYRFDPLPGALALDQRHLLGLQGNLWTEHVRTEERAAYMTYPRAAALAELAWSPPQRLDWGDFRRRLRVQFQRYRALGLPYSNDVFASAALPAPQQRHMSQDLRTCTDKLVLSLEDDAPRNGTRAVFLIDIMNPCWIFPGVDLTAAPQFTAAVGQVPFNFQLGAARAGIRLEPPVSGAGELQVHVDDCGQAPLVTLPLSTAADSDTVTVLPSVRLPALAGRHDLCLNFTQAQLDPLWAIDWVQVSP